MVGHNPESYQEGKETEYVQKQDNAFGQWQVLCEEHVEAHCQDDEQEHHQGCLPQSRYVCVRMNE